MRRTYSTLDEAIRSEIVEPIAVGDADWQDYDVDAIASACICRTIDGLYKCSVSVETFWAIVEVNYIGPESAA